MSIELKTCLGTRVNRYTVLIDGVPWGWTTDGDIGLSLAIAIVKLEEQRGARMVS